MATPTVDIGYNFGRSDKNRQSIDFLLFDARTSDEFIQRLGRASRVLGRSVTDQPSEVWAVVPDELLVALKEWEGQTIERRDLNRCVGETLPPKNGLYSYVRSGAICEAFLPLYMYGQSLHPDDRHQAAHLYEALCQVYDNTKPQTYKRLENNIRRYLKLKLEIKQLEKEAKAQTFEFGVASTRALALYDRPEADPASLDNVDETQAKNFRQQILAKRKTPQAKEQRQKAIEEYYLTETRFNFRDSYQPPQVEVYDPQHLLASDDNTNYSALHIIQNFEADWTALNADDQAQTSDKLPLTCTIRRNRQKRLNLYFQLDCTAYSQAKWEENYCNKGLAATTGFSLRADEGAVIPPELNEVFEQKYIAFYAVPLNTPEYRTLLSFNRTTALYTNKLKIDFSDQTDKEYLLVLGSAALQLSYEGKLFRAKKIAQREAARYNHIFDWEG